MDIQLGPSSSQPGLYSRLHPAAVVADARAANARSQADFIPPMPVAAPVTPSTSIGIGTRTRTRMGIASQSPFTSPLDQNATPARKMRKRKAESQDNERLNKRLSLLNLEQNGQKLYVPVESPQLNPTATSSLRQIPEAEQMQLDDSKHKVYIYDLDAELSDGESSSDEGKLVFLPDIAKHLRQQSRIPPRVLANNDGELAGMQLVLYSEPKSLTVPEAQDSVRKAIVEARARLRNKQGGADADADMNPAAAASHMDIEETPGRCVPNGPNNLANDRLQPPTIVFPSGGTSVPTTQYDPDAMDMDID